MLLDMKVEALRPVLERCGRIKLYVTFEDACLCGYVSSVKPAEPDVIVEVGASVRFAFATRSIEEARFRTGPVRLTSSCKVSRRIQTHRRHLARIDVPDEYYLRAMAL